MKKYIIYITLILSSCNTADDFYEKGDDKMYLDDDYEKAIVYFNKAIELDSNHIRSYRRRAEARVKVEDYQGAILDYTKIIEFQDYPKKQISPRQAKFYQTDYVLQEAYHGRGIVKEKIKDYKGAFSDFNKALKVNPNRHANRRNSYYNRGKVKGIFKDYEGAISDFDKAIESNPKFFVLEIKIDIARIYYNRGLMKLKLCKTSKACIDFRKADELVNNGYHEAEKAIKEYCK